MDNPKLSAKAKAKLGLRMYRDEMFTPTKPRRPQQYDGVIAYSEWPSEIPFPVAPGSPEPSPAK